VAFQCSQTCGVSLAATLEPAASSPQCKRPGNTSCPDELNQTGSGHLHEFVIGDDHYGQPDPHFDTPPLVQRDDRVALAAALGVHKSFLYLYDFGDGWEHRVKVEKILPPDAGLRLPLCLDGANACPLEDVGGPPGYAYFLEAIRDPAHEEHAAMLQWCGGAFDPAAFSVDHINANLRTFKL
jgi:hypothetical protein